MKKNKLAVLVLASMMSLSLSLLSYAEEGQSARWAGPETDGRYLITTAVLLRTAGFRMM